MNTPLDVTDPLGMIDPREPLARPHYIFKEPPPMSHEVIKFGAVGVFILALVAVVADPHLGMQVGDKLTHLFDVCSAFFHQ